MGTKRYATLYERLVANTEEPAGEQACWLWKGKLNRRGGYGQFNVRQDGKHVTLYAHREILPALGIEIPPGHEPDHLCRESRCINPDHLEVVTAEENNRRRWSRIYSSSSP